MNTKEKSVLFLTLYPDTAASPRYRVTQFLPKLRERNLRCVVASAVSEKEFARLTGPRREVRPFWYHLHETRRRIKQLLGASSYDIVFVQKALLSTPIKGLLALLRRSARPLVYDLDDAVHLTPPHPLRPPWRILEDPGQIRKLMACADLVLAGNRWLAGEAEKEGANTVLFPTVVDTERFVPAPNDGHVYRIGWVGNPSTMVCLAPASEALSAVEGGEVYLVGGEEKDNTIAGATVKAWRYESEVEDIQHFSVGVMPMPEGDWMLGKCGLKALQYMACGVPCIATPYGAALEIIQHDENGLFASTTAEWTEALARLRDPALRKRLGEAGRATVEERYSLKKAAPKLHELLEGLS